MFSSPSTSWLRSSATDMSVDAGTGATAETMPEGAAGVAIVALTVGDNETPDGRPELGFDPEPGGGACGIARLRAATMTCVAAETNGEADQRAEGIRWRVRVVSGRHN